MDWIVYILSCSDGSLYTGITRDLARRFQEHQTGRGARYFRARKPVEVVFTEDGHSHSSAARREWEIKRLNRGGKLALVEAGPAHVSLEEQDA